MLLCVVFKLSPAAFNCTDFPHQVRRTRALDRQTVGGKRRDLLISKLALDFFFHSRTVHLDIIKVLLPTDSEENCFKTSIKIYIKTAPTCFGVNTIIRECTI